MEVAGFSLGAVALVPPTLQLIDVCASFYAEVSHFGRSTKQLSLKFTHLRSRYDALQRLLFQKGKFAFADTLFQCLPEQDQRVIYAMLQELAGVFYKHYMLSQTYRLGSELPQPNLPEIEALTAALATPETNIGSLEPSEGHSSLLSLRHLWWATRGKKRAERLLTDFEGWLRRIKDILEDTWWLLPALERYANLKSLEDDRDAKDVGISSTAGLKKLLLDTTETPADLNLDTANLTVEYFTPQRGVASLDGESILVEAFSFEADKDGFIPQTLGHRFEAIANLLHAQNDAELRVLPCKGYRYSSAPVSQFQLLLEIPPDSRPQPISLLDVLGMKMRTKPDLTQRFQLCWQISQSLISMHSVGWLHRGLRSENIICFAPSEIDLGQENLASQFFDHFVVSGFDSSRLEADFSLGPYDDAIEKNVYRHPERWGAPRRTFSRIHDIYALGVILLEIGLWEKALLIGGNNFVTKPRDASSISTELHRQAEARLGHRCGSKFRSIVLRCLQGDFSDPAASDETTAPTSLQSRFRELVVDPLHRLHLEV